MLCDYIARYGLAVAAGLTVQLVVLAVQRWLHRRFSMRDVHLLTLPEAAKRLGVSYQNLLRTIERDFFEGAIWIGRQRGVREEDLGRLREAIKAAGYLD